MYKYSDTNLDAKHHKLIKTGKLSLLILLAIILPFGAILAACASDKPSVDGVTITKASMEMTVGQKLQFEASVASSKDEDKGKIAWSTSDSSIVTISESGLAEAKASGTVQVTVKSTVDSRAFSTISVTVTKSAEQEFLEKYDALIHYDASKLDKLSADELVDLYNELSTSMDELNNVASDMPESNTENFLTELGDYVTLIGNTQDYIEQHIGNKFDTIFGIMQNLDASIDTLFEEIDNALANDSASQDMLDAWQSQVSQFESDLQTVKADTSTIQDGDTTKVDELVIKLLQQEITLQTSDIETVKEFLDLVEPNVLFSTISNYQNFVEHFSAGTRFGSASWHIWGRRIRLSQSEVNQILNVINVVSLLSQIVGRIPKIGWILKIIITVNAQPLKWGFNRNNGPNGVRIDINWGAMAVMVAAPISAGVTMALCMKRG